MNPQTPQTSENRYPGILVSALRGGSGKTILAVGITAALRRRGVAVTPFKKGPDYIDAGWLASAAGRTCYNLDSFIIDQDQLLCSFHRHARDGQIAVVEGNRGLYDCIHTDGKTSSAELAKLLGLPVLLCIDATKTTRTMAAVVSGCCQFDPELRLGGVILNRVAGARHENILRDSITGHCGVPVVGAVPKLKQQAFPERHMGLVPTAEHNWAADSVAVAGAMAERYLDLEQILAIARSARGPLTPPPPEPLCQPSPAQAGAPVIGVIRDSAFQFYYPENLEAIEAAGARLVFTSPLTQDRPPAVDALYIGGGFPETHAEALSRNAGYRDEIRKLAARGLPIYAECGGLMFLGERLVIEERTYPMAGVLPISFGFSRRPMGHGYTLIRVAEPNPYFGVGTELRGHEFHYSKVLEWRGRPGDLAFSMTRGGGITEGRDGLCRGNVLATYTHLHALGTPGWAPALVRAARGYQKRRPLL
ncbi:MAG: cobyrinate a,c-diamide synthase [Deltaproteobacteria bacterium]|nr:cobyrinate a,c-diamide synthase [Deltaproteobacteria bacterium]RLB93917.1 MAG: cobyrinic acid a,c-diamide synthase [Deltaproteobacteria bacterium]